MQLCFLRYFKLKLPSCCYRSPIKYKNVHIKVHITVFYPEISTSELLLEVQYKLDLQLYISTSTYLRIDLSVYLPYVDSGEDMAVGELLRQGGHPGGQQD